MAQQRDCEKEGGVNWQRLKELAEKARPGPWSVNHDWVVSQYGVAVAQAYLGFCGPEDGVAEVFTGANDAAFIAALDPATVLQMVAEHASVREALERARGCITELAQRSSATPSPELLAEIDAGASTAGPVFFYERDYYVLSNFSAFRLKWRGIDFDTSEHAYHWEKFPHSFALQEHIRKAPSAHEAFKRAEATIHHRRSDWYEDTKLNVMRDILRAKVAQHEYVRRKLLATDDRELIEDSWRDDYWGWGPNRDGKNMLGKLWMEIRSELASKESAGEPGVDPWLQTR